MIRIEKLTLNIGAGKDQAKLDKGLQLLQLLTGIPPVKTFTAKRIPGWGLRPGLPIGCKLTLRRDKARQMLIRLLKARDNNLLLRQFDDHGNLAFGVHEYIDVPDMKYNPDIGIMGFEVCVTLARPGFRVKRRKLQKRKVHPKHEISREEAVDFLKKEFNVQVGDDE